MAFTEHYRLGLPVFVASLEFLMQQRYLPRWNLALAQRVSMSYHLDFQYTTPVECPYPECATLEDIHYRSLLEPDPRYYSDAGGTLQFDPKCVMLGVPVCSR